MDRAITVATLVTEIATGTPEMMSSFSLRGRDCSDAACRKRVRPSDTMQASRELRLFLCCDALRCSATAGEHPLPVSLLYLHQTGAGNVKWRYSGTVQDVS